MTGTIDNTSNLLGTVQTPYAENNIGTSITSNSVVNFPADLPVTVYLFVVSFYSEFGFTMLADPTITLNNCSTAGFVSDNLFTGNVYVGYFYIRITNPTLPATVTFSGGTYPTSSSSGRLIISTFNFSS